VAQAIGRLARRVAARVRAAGATRWAPDEIAAKGEHMQRLHEEMASAGELLGSEQLAGPEATKVVANLDGETVVTDGPYPGAKEVFAGFWYVGVESEARALEIAARTSAAPAPGGRTLGRRTVRPIMEMRGPQD
jgi:hypothetical protein